MANFHKKVFIPLRLFLLFSSKPEDCKRVDECPKSKIWRLKEIVYIILALFPNIQLQHRRHHGVHAPAKVDVESMPFCLKWRMT